MSAPDTSDESGWPLTPAERDWNQWQLFAVLLVTAAATWCYIIGEYVGYYLNLKMGMAAMTAGAMIGMLLVTLAVVPTATRYGIDSIAADSITADELAAWMGTIHYEVTTRISERLPRIQRGETPRWHPGERAATGG